jgi:hypothetical protein
MVALTFILSLIFVIFITFIIHRSALTIILLYGLRTYDSVTNLEQKLKEIFHDTYLIIICLFVITYLIYPHLIIYYIFCYFCGTLLYSISIHEKLIGLYKEKIEVLKK